MSPRQTAPPAYTSGYCGTGAHDRCRGSYAGAACRCDCHSRLLDALSTAHLVAADAYADLAQSRAELAVMEARYGEAMNALHRAIDDVVYGPPRAAEPPGDADA